MNRIPFRDSHGGDAPCCTVLLVDDDPVTLRSWVAILRCGGIESLTAHDGAEAIEIAMAHLISVVMTDYEMPAIDGIDLFTRLRRRRPLLRGILCSGVLDAEVLMRSIAAGFHLVLSKDQAGPSRIVQAVFDQCTQADTMRHLLDRVPQQLVDPIRESGGQQ